MSNIGILKDAKEIFLAKFGYFDGSFVGENGKKILYPKREAFDSRHLTDHSVAVPEGLAAIYPANKPARIFSEMPSGWLLSWSARDMSVKYFTDLSCICNRIYKDHVIAVYNYHLRGSLMYKKLKAADPKLASDNCWQRFQKAFDIIEKELANDDVVNFDGTLFNKLQPLDELYLDDVKKSITPQ